MRHARKFSTLESLDTITRADVEAATRPDVERFVRDFRGNSWRSIRAMSRLSLNDVAVETAETSYNQTESKS